MLFKTWYFQITSSLHLLSKRVFDSHLSIKSGRRRKISSGGNFSPKIYFSRNFGRRREEPTPAGGQWPKILSSGREGARKSGTCGGAVSRADGSLFSAATFFCARSSNRPTNEAGDPIAKYFSPQRWPQTAAEVSRKGGGGAAR